MRLKRTIRAKISVLIAVAILPFYLSTCTGSLASPVFDSKSFENIHAAVSALGKRAAVLSLAGRHKISRNLLVPGNITLRFQKDASIFVENGRWVTIESPLEAPLGKIFEGEGMVKLKGSEVYPQWWGARGNGVQDDGYPIQAAIDSVHAGGGGGVRLPKGTYLLNHVSGPYYALKGRDRVSLVGEGSESILKVGDRLRQANRGVAVLYNHEEPVSRCRYSQFTVDYNGENNPRLASWGKDANVSNVSRLGAEFASEIVVEGVRFEDVSGAHCIWFGNHPTNHRNAVLNCFVSNVGQSVPGNQLTDHSSIYMGGRNGLVNGNVFHNQVPCNISTAIEVHSSDTIVSNNSVKNYATAVNIAGEANDCSNVFLTNNTFKNNRNGIVIWHYSPYTMKNITISGNVISVRETDATPYPPSMGIIYGGGYVTSKRNLSGLKISDNTFFQETTTVPNRQPNTAVHVESTDDVAITENTIYNFNGEAVYIQSRSREQGMKGAVISGNDIKNVGLTSTPARKRAIVFNSYPTPAGSITDVFVQNNRIIAGGKPPMLNGITFNDGSFPRVEISGNVISGTSQFEIINNSSDQDGLFHVDHIGRGTPVNHLRASRGSRWVDVTSGRTYTFQGSYGAGSGSADWVLTD